MAPPVRPVSRPARWPRCRAARWRRPGPAVRLPAPAAWRAAAPGPPPLRPRYTACDALPLPYAPPPAAGWWICRCQGRPPPARPSFQQSRHPTRDQARQCRSACVRAGRFRRRDQQTPPAAPGRPWKRGRGRAGLVLPRPGCSTRRRHRSGPATWHAPRRSFDRRSGFYPWPCGEACPGPGRAAISAGLGGRLTPRDCAAPELPKGWLWAGALPQSLPRRRRASPAAGPPVRPWADGW